jgi:cysteine-rich repeat protein
VLTEYCGDGIKQPGEDCDDGNRVNDDACNNACRNLIVK